MPLHLDSLEIHFQRLFLRLADKLIQPSRLEQDQRLLSAKRIQDQVLCRKPHRMNGTTNGVFIIFRWLLRSGTDISCYDNMYWCSFSLPLRNFLLNGALLESAPVNISLPVLHSFFFASPLIT